MTELKPCDCGSDDVSIRRTIDTRDYKYCHRAGCNKCLKSTVAYPTEAEAIEAWNRRVE